MQAHGGTHGGAVNVVVCVFCCSQTQTQSIDHQLTSICYRLGRLLGQVGWPRRKSTTCQSGGPALTLRASPRLIRQVGRHEDEEALYHRAVARGVWQVAQQRPGFLYRPPASAPPGPSQLRAKPWWRDEAGTQREELTPGAPAGGWEGLWGAVKLLEEGFKEIAAEFAQNKVRGTEKQER